MSYLNRSEKTRVTLLLLIEVYLKKCIEEGRKGEKKWLKSALTFLQKHITSIIDPLDDTNLQIINKESSNHQLILLPKDDIINVMKKGKVVNNNFVLKRDDFYEICEHALSRCTGCSKDHKDCRLKELFLLYEVPMFDEDTDDCPFRMVM